jgi:hypothetical protein
LESLASDLKRVALGIHRGSNQMAERFLEEALKRKSELKQNEIPPYIQNLLNHLDKKISSDYALMCSTLIQNYTRYKKFQSASTEVG